MPKKKKTEPEAAAPDIKREPEPAPPPASDPAPRARPSLPPDAPVAIAADISLDASANAPFVYFDNAGVSGYMNGIVRVTLEAGRVMPGENNKVFVDRVIVGHLRMNIPAAQSLRNALDRALLLGSKPATDKMN